MLSGDDFDRTAIGLRVKDGVVLAVEKVVHSKLLVPAANRRIQTVDKHVGLVRLLSPVLTSLCLPQLYAHCVCARV